MGTKNRTIAIIVENISLQTKLFISAWRCTAVKAEQVKESLLVLKKCQFFVFLVATILISRDPPSLAAVLLNKQPIEDVEVQPEVEETIT